MESKILGCLMYNIMPPSINGNLNLHCETNKDYKNNAASSLNSEDLNSNMSRSLCIWKIYYMYISYNDTNTIK